MRTPFMLLRAIALAMLLLPAAASAGKLTVDFDFSGSSVSILGGLIDVPPDGSIGAASGQIDFFGALGTATAQGGAAQIKNLALSGTFAKSTFGLDLSGAVGMTQGGVGAGGITGGLANASFNPFLIDLTGFANCAGGTGCTVLGLPATFNGQKAVSIPALAVFNLNSIGNAMVSGIFTLTIGGFTAVLNLVGNEVGRTFIPEPHTAGLMMLGVAGLAIARRARRR
jgi:hypothetical protein